MIVIGRWGHAIKPVANARLEGKAERKEHLTNRSKQSYKEDETKQDYQAGQKRSLCRPTPASRSDLYLLVHLKRSILCWLLLSVHKCKVL